MKNKIFILLLFFAGWQATQALNLSMYKALNDSAYQTTTAYQTGNKLRNMESKEMIWRKGDEQYYPDGVTDSNYCILKFTATDGRFYSDFYPRSFVIR